MASKLVNRVIVLSTVESYHSVGRTRSQGTRSSAAALLRSQTASLCTARQAVDQLVGAAAVNAGIADVNPKQDHGFMYGPSCEDVEGHNWETVFVDMPQFPKGD